LTDYNSVKDVLSQASYFKYACNQNSVYSAASNCFDVAYNYFNPSYLHFTIMPMSNILSFRLMLNNSQSTSISSACASTIKADTFILSEILGSRLDVSIDDELPRKQAYLLSSVGSVSSTSSMLYLILDLSSVRTTNSYLCSTATYSAFNVQSCYALIEVYLQTTNTRVEMFRREFYSYTYNTLPQNITVKTAFIQQYVNECEDCNLVIDKEIMVKLCNDESCVSPLTNNSIMVTNTVYAQVGLFDPVLLFNYSIISLQVFANSQDITNTAAIKMLNDGTATSMQVDIIIYHRSHFK
jgi:hypothetical protein